MKINHRRALSGGLVATLAVAALAGCASSPGEASDTVKVTLANHPWNDATQEWISEFEEDSGLKVELTSYSETQLLDQYNVKLNAGSTDIDVMMYQPVVVGQLFADNRWLADLSDYVDSSAEWDWDDFQESARSTVTFDEAVYGVPLTAETEVLYYRKDLLEKAGLEVPQTMEELASAVETVAAQNPDVNGFVARGARSAAVSQFSSFLYSFGADWQDGDTATVDSDEAIEAYEFYGSMIRDFGPDGATSMGWPEAMALFTQGMAAFYPESSALYTNAVDADSSTVADNVGFAPFPEGPDGAKPYNVPAWALGVNEASTNKDNAWKFIEWMTSKQRVLDLQEAGIAGSRQSAWDDPQGVAGFPSDLVDAMRIGQANGIGHYFPAVAKIGEARDIIGDPIVAAIDGKDVREAAEKANAKLQKLLDDSNR